jgi:hypothetical protein
MEKVKKDYSPGKLSVVETIKGMVFSTVLSAIALTLLKLSPSRVTAYTALSLSTASFIVAIYYSVKAIIHYLMALKAIDKDHNTKLFVGGLLTVLGTTFILIGYLVGARNLVLSLPALVGLSILAVQFWRLSVTQN